MDSIWALHMVKNHALYNIMGDLHETHRILQSSVAQLLSGGEKLNALQEKSDRLVAQSKLFDRKVYWSLWCCFRRGCC